jgi:hypothetical protein
MPLVWPASLPVVPLVDGFEELAVNITIRSSIDAGPPKVRRRFTANVSQITCRYTFSKAHCTTLDDFYFVSAAGGAIPFEWLHPRREETINVRFKEPPKYTAQAPDVWTAACIFETLPPGVAATLAAPPPVPFGVGRR